MTQNERPYTRSHPWLSFTLDLRELPTAVWIMLGEAASKVEHVAGMPLKPRVAVRLHNLYLAKGALATTAIEGNTLTEDEVLRRLDGDLELPPSREYLGIEIDNVVSACGEIWAQLEASGPEPLSASALERFNAAVLKDLKLEEGVIPGQVRNHPVVVARYRGAPAEDCRYLLDQLCTWLEGPAFSGEGLSGEMVVALPIIRAVVAHLYLAWIHPFGDGNGRTARLVEFQLLLRAAFPTPAAHLLSNHYNQTRSDYYRHLDQATRPGGVAAFIQYAVRGLVDGLREQIGAIRAQQMELAWNDYVAETLRGAGSVRDRRRKLVLALSNKTVAAKGIPDLTPELARLYAAKTGKTLSRDLNALVGLNLVVAKGGLYSARTELISAFLPGRRKGPAGAEKPGG